MIALPQGARGADHPPALGREEARDLGSDAAGGAGHHYDLAVELSHGRQINNAAGRPTQDRVPERKGDLRGFPAPASGKHLMEVVLPRRLLWPALLQGWSTSKEGPHGSGAVRRVRWRPGCAGGRHESPPAHRAAGGASEIDVSQLPVWQRDGRGDRRPQGESAPSAQGAYDHRAPVGEPPPARPHRRPRELRLGTGEALAPWGFRRFETAISPTMSRFWTAARRCGLF